MAKAKAQPKKSAASKARPTAAAKATPKPKPAAKPVAKRAAPKKAAPKKAAPKKAAPKKAAPKKAAPKRAATRAATPPAPKPTAPKPAVPATAPTAAAAKPAAPKPAAPKPAVPAPAPKPAAPKPAAPKPAPAAPEPAAPKEAAAKPTRPSAAEPVAAKPAPAAATSAAPARPAPPRPAVVPAQGSSPAITPPPADAVPETLMERTVSRAEAIALTPTGTAPARAPLDESRIAHAVPEIQPEETSGPLRASSGEVMRILDAADPLVELRAFLDDIHGAATVQQGQIALGAAQLMLLPIAREHRGGTEVKELLDLVLRRWPMFSERNRTGFHAQEFLRNAFAAVGDDRERISRLTALVPVNATPELRFNVACALAVAGERDAMVRAIEVALAAGVSAAKFRRDPDFEPYLDDPSFGAVLDRATAPQIPVDVAPYVGTVRASLDSTVRTLRELGEVANLAPPASLDTVLAAERVRKVQLPNDYRALLTISDGMTLWDHVFMGTVDYRNETDLAKQARRYLDDAARAGAAGADDCVPLANWGQPNDWLLYDPIGRLRGGSPGYVLRLNTDACPLDGLAHALDRFERVARDVLGTN